MDNLNIAYELKCDDNFNLKASIAKSEHSYEPYKYYYESTCLNTTSAPNNISSFILDCIIM